MKQQLQDFINYMTAKGYSSRSIATYRSCVRDFLISFSKPNLAKDNEINAYLAKITNRSSRKQHVSNYSISKVASLLS